MASKVPSLNAAAVDDSGRFTTEWVGFFNKIAGSPGAIETVTPTGSPFSFTAPTQGTLLISGGTVSAVTLTRARMTVDVASGAVPPLSAGDVVAITYTVAPSLSFVPRTT